MKQMRQAKRILKLYGKAEYEARAAYVKGFMTETPSYIGRISWKHLGKRCLMFALILILTFSMMVTVVGAFGFHLPGLSFSEWSDHTEIMRNEEEEIEGEARLYEPTYIPEGYELIETDEFMDIRVDRVYQDAGGKLLYIEQCQAEGFAANVNNEDCTRGTLDIDGNEVMAYYYYDDGTSQYLVNIANTVITISGFIDDEECKRIVRGLK